MRAPARAAATAVSLVAALLAVPTLGAPAQAVSGVLVPTTHDPVCDNLGLPEPFCDRTAPTTHIDTAPPTKQAVAEDATFTFSTAPAEAGATFQCQLTKDQAVVSAFEDCTTPPAPGATTSTGTRTYPALTEGSYVFAVHATDTAHNQGVDAVFQWTVGNATPAEDQDAPQTTLTDSPRRWNLDTWASFEFTASEPVSGWACTLDGAPLSCTTSGGRFVQGLRAGTHAFRVSAVDYSGNVDPTPARSVFTVPLNNTKLKEYSGGWTRKSCRGCFLETASVTAKKGAWVTQGTSGMRRLALIVTKAPGYGTVKVYFRKQLLRTVSLDASSRKVRQVVAIKSWTHLQQGKIRIVVSSSGRTVALEGLGIASR